MERDVVELLEGLDAEPPRDADRALRLVHRWMQAKRDERTAAAALERFRAKHAPAPVPLPWGRVVAGLAAACALVVAMVAWRPARPVAPQLAVASPADGARWSLKTASGAPATALARGVTLAVEAGDASVGVPGLALRLRKDGAVRVEELAGKNVELAQVSGAGVYEVTPGAGVRLSIAAGGAVVRVKGTRFRVTVLAAGAAVAVGAGEVQVARGEQVRAVSAGHELTWKEDGALGEPAAFNAIVDPDFAASGEAQIGITR